MPCVISQEGAAGGDVLRTYHATITGIEPLTQRCREWVDDNVEAEG